MPISELQTSNDVTPAAVLKAYAPESGFRFNRLKVEALVAISATGVVCALAWADPAVRHSITGLWGHICQDYLRLWNEKWICNTGFYVALAIALLLEFLIPAKQEQTSMTIGFRHDFLWTFIQVMMSVLLMPICVVGLRSICTHYLGFLAIDSLAGWPVVARVVLALLVSDFVAWLAHVARHKANLLWQFHAVHHSQRELNFFTESRRHPIDVLIVYVRLLLPFFMFNLPLEYIAGLYWLRRWHERLYHSNIRSNFGILRYILVTPQSHRVHHSIELRHRDTNFGETFSIWDHLFGTQYRNYDEYPDTGIDDPRFPLEQEATGLWGGVRSLVAQLVYPFKAIARG